MAFRAAFRPPLVGKGGFKGPPLGACEEDRANDWYCNTCRERNFAKRKECFKCQSARPKEGEGKVGPRVPMPAPGSTVNGMVKSYNKRGFGFIMIFGMDDGQDIYYTRENVSPALLHPDMPGEQVTFELQREAGRLVAKHIRPIGQARDAKGAKGGHVFGTMGKGKAVGEEDRSRDWVCTSCGERNFLKRMECFKCNKRRETFYTAAEDEKQSAPTAPPRRTFSPHAGSRAVRESMKAPGDGQGSDGSRGSSSGRRGRKTKGKKRRKKHRSSSSDSSSSSSGRSRKKRRRSSSSSSSRSRGRGGKKEGSAGSAGGASALASAKDGDPPEIAKAKGEAAAELMKLKSVEPREKRMKDWRALLRNWHPDKNPDRVEVATAVFQFLQKAKPLLDP